MSRIGRQAIKIPAGVTVAKEGENIITVKGPLGTLKQHIDEAISVKIENGVISFTRNSDEKEIRAKHGLYRMLVANMITGVTKGYEKSLVVNGVGYKASKQGNKLVLNIGFSHNVEFLPPQGIQIDCPSVTEITVKGISKEAVGQTAANIRALKKVEPYHLYGIRYKDEILQKKEGKTAGK